MTVLAPHKLQDSLTKMEKGSSWILSSLQRYDEYSEMITNAMNGEYDSFDQEQFAKCFKFSFDEEAAELSLFIEEFLGNAVSYKWPDQEQNTLSILVAGIDSMVEGLDEIIELCKEDNGTKQELRYFKSSNGYQPFKEYGFSNYQKNLRGFRRALLSTLKQIVGHYQYQKVVKK